MLELKQCGLLVVDVQGKLARLMHNSDAVIANIVKLVQASRVLSLPVIALEQYPKGLGETVPELRDLLKDDEIIPKTSFGGCGAPDFMTALNKAGRRQWLVCGIESHVCVYQTVSGMLSAGHEVEVITDAVSSREAANIPMALAKMQRRGAELTSVEMCLFELMQDCKSEAFKAMLPLLK